jgi:hypothetical protein
VKEMCHDLRSKEVQSFHLFGMLVDLDIEMENIEDAQEVWLLTLTRLDADI